MNTTPERYEDRKIREAEESGDAQRVRYWRHIKATVDAMPPITDDEIVKLRAIFNSPGNARRRTA